MQSGLMGVTLNDNAAPSASVIYSSLKASSSSGGTTPYVVSSSGPYTTVQAAMNAASAAGGGVVYVKPGVYAENLTIPNNVAVEGSFADLSLIDINQANMSTITGTHTFAASVTQAAFFHIVFGPTASGTSPIFTIAPTVASTIEFSNCAFSSALNSGSPASLINCSSTATLTLTLTDVSMLVAPGVGDCIDVGSNCTVNMSQSNLQVNSPASCCVYISSASATVNSSYNIYTATGPCVKFASTGIMTSAFDSYASQSVSGYFVDTTGPVGQYAPSVIAVQGLALRVNPTISTAVQAVSSLTVSGNLVLFPQLYKQSYVSLASSTAAGAYSAGTVPLVGGTAIVSTTAVTASSVIRLTCQALGTVVNPSALCVSAKVAGTSFTIKASQATDTSTIFWEIIN